MLTGVCLVWALMVSAYIARSTVLSHWAKTTKRFCPTTADPFWVCNEGGGGISGTHTKHTSIHVTEVIEPLEQKQRHRQSSASIVYAMAFQTGRIRYATSISALKCQFLTRCSMNIAHDGRDEYIILVKKISNTVLDYACMKIMQIIHACIESDMHISMANGKTKPG